MMGFYEWLIESFSPVDTLEKLIPKFAVSKAEIIEGILESDAFNYYLGYRLDCDCYERESD